MNAAGEAVAKGYNVYSIHNNLRGVKWNVNTTALEGARGKHLKLLHCHNAGAERKKAHPDERIQGVKAIGWKGMVWYRILGVYTIPRYVMELIPYLLILMGWYGKFMETGNPS